MKIKSLSLVMAAVCGLFLVSGAQAQVREHQFRWTTANPAGHPIVLGGEKFAQLLSQKSGGKMTVKLFPGGVLGGDVQVLSAVQGGTIDMTSMNSGILQAQVKEFAIVDFPFLFGNAQEADAVLDGPMGKELADKLPAKGLVNLAYYDLGFRNVTDSRRPIKTADDIAGLKLRVIQSPIYIDTFNALGANAVPMAFPEVYTALEQKTIDGQENPYTVILANKFNEVQKYLGGHAAHLQPAVVPDEQEELGQAQQGRAGDRARCRARNRRSTSARCRVTRRTRRSPSSRRRWK